jgi:hypothetical protein
MVIDASGVLKNIENGNPGTEFTVTSNIWDGAPDIYKRIYVKFTPIEEVTV